MPSTTAAPPTPPSTRATSTLGSESVKVRERLDSSFGGAGGYALQVAVHSQDLTVADPAFRRTVARTERILAVDSAVGTVVPPGRGASISRDGHTVIVGATAAKSPNGMVAAANDLKTGNQGRRHVRA